MLPDIHTPLDVLLYSSILFSAMPDEFRIDTPFWAPVIRKSWSSMSLVFLISIPLADPLPSNQVPPARKFVLPWIFNGSPAIPLFELSSTMRNPVFTG